MAVIAVIGLIYLLKLVLLTTLGALLLAYVLEPLVSGLGRLKVPRALGALIALLLVLVLCAGMAYFSYNRAVDFSHQLPTYSAKIRETLGKTLGKIWAQTGRIEEAATPTPPGGQKPVPVKVQQGPRLTGTFSSLGGTLVDVLVALSFLPFLTYFMLTGKEHSHAATMHLFPKEHRLSAFRTIGRISAMIRTYIVANMALGFIDTGICLALFWLLHIKYFYFLAVLSGFLSLVPYLGVFLAVLPPLAAGIGTLTKTGAVIVVVAIVAMHVIVINAVYPRFVGGRLQLNPLAVSLALLFWTWIWGAAGLIFAIPILGAAKIVCDHVDPLRGLGEWLGEPQASRQP